MTTSNNVVSPRTPSTPLVDSNGQMAFVWVKFFQDLAQAVNSALTILGQFNGQIGAQATVVSHTGTLANAIQHLSSAGVIQAGGIDFNVTAPAFSQVTGTAVPAQLPSATDLAHGAVTLPVGAPSTTLGTAAFNNTGDFDPAGAAATAQANAETFAANANNLSSGTVAAGRIPAGIPFVSFGVGAPAIAGTEAYLYFDTTATPYHGYVYHSGAWVQFS